MAQRDPRRKSRSRGFWEPFLRGLEAFGLAVNDVMRSWSDAMVALSRASTDAQTAALRRIADVLYLLLKGLDLSVVGVLFRSLAIAPTQRKSARQKTLSHAIEALQSASSFVQELEGDLQKRTQQLRDLQARYARLEELTAVEEEKARTILGEVEETIGRGRRREYVAGFVINAVVAALFLLLGLWIGK